MNPEFIFYANVVMLLRLPLLLRDASVSPWCWQLKTAVEWLVLLCFLPDWILLGLAGGSLVLNSLAAPGRRFPQPRAPQHLLLLAVHVVAASFAFAPAFGVGFRPELLTWAGPLRESTALGGLLLALTRPDAMLIAFGLLLAANESNLLIRWLLGFLELKPTGMSSQRITPLEYKRGRVIGLIERIMIYSFVLSGQFVAVGFVLAAKGFTRSRDVQPDDRDFTEYIIIGTLMSVGLAMLLGTLVAWALG